MQKDFTTEPNTKTKTNTDTDTDTNTNTNDNTDVVPFDTKIGGTPFSVLFSQAVKLKTAQEAPTRSKFDAYPPFIQNSIYPPIPTPTPTSTDTSISTDEIQVDVHSARTKEFKERYKHAIHFKSLGNQAFEAWKYTDAMTHYEHSVAVFRFLVNTNPAWKKQGIRDEDVEEIVFQGKSDFENGQVCDLLISCYT